MLEHFLLSNHHEKLDAGGKPSTWFPPGGLVEHIFPNEHKNTNKVNASNHIHLQVAANDTTSKRTNDEHDETISANASTTTTTQKINNDPNT